MCGICGVLRINPNAEKIEQSLLDRQLDLMTDSLAHRGPNDRGTWSDGRASLGSRRLSVIDLSSAGHMPMANEDGSVRIVYNGELYNFRELKEQFKLAERYTFHSRTDTEVLLHLYEELGVEMARHLNGMFAIAIWDGRNGTLHLIRDHAGIKPLFYQQDENHFRFGSEIKAILTDPRVPRRPSLQALYDFLTFDYVPGAQTAFEGIYEVPPGHWMSVDTSGNTTLQRYWDLSWQLDESLDEQTASRRAYELMDKAVERQLVADVPVGVLLSGGMDSSTLVALMSRHTSEPIHTYSVGFEDASFNELPYARIVAKQFNTVQREVVVTPGIVRELLPDYLRFIDEPYADGSAIPTYCVCRIAKDEVVVVLSGEGGDEVFAGYETYAAYKASQWFNRIPRFIRRKLIAPLVGSLPVSDKKLSLEFKMKRFLGGQDLSPAEAHLWWRVVLTEAQKHELLAPQVFKQFDPQPSVRHFTDVFNRSNASETLSRLMHIDSAVFLPDDLMIKNDRMSMAHSLEARVPLTDPDLMNFLASVPARLKLPGLRKKNLMRRAMEGTLPPAILNKKKVGLEMPYSRWFKNELKETLLHHLSPARLAERGLFNPQAVQLLIDEHLAGKRDHGRALWGLINYAMWLEIYIP
ncbi:MAG: asparagine synthase (glutamine-hydrolyzing) [Acidobacteriota bacterium]